MMTDAMKPLGLSVRDLTGRRSMHVAGGRMFVDVAPLLASPAGRESLIDVLGKSDPLIKDALTEIIRRGNFPESEPQEKSHASHDFRMLGEYDARTVAGLINESESELSELKKIIENLSASALIDCILSDLEKLSKSISDPRVFGVIMTGMNAAFWLNDRMEEWLNEKNVADTLSLSVPDNITSEMGLALLDVSDVIRRHDRVVDYLQRTKDDNFLDRLGDIEGGVEARQAIVDFLERYGMRCAGEIDITRPRWSEKPLTLVPAILTNVRNLEPNEASRRFERGKQEYLRKENELLERLRHLADGEEKAKETKRMIDLMRCLAGFREYPKYAMVCRYFVYKRALLKEAAVMSRQGIINEPEDIYYLTLGELKEGNIDRRLIVSRKEEYRQFEKLAPPRVMTSDGEIITGRYNREGLPGGAIAGLAVSSGMIEGRARVILKIEDADLEEGDILVTTFTDPSWTPLFVSIKGLVTEVGGLMTHGAVIAREYGLPAVVGVENATRTIRDGDRIRVNGSEGYVEILERRAD
jgi:pyruvate,water dikinase